MSHGREVVQSGKPNKLVYTLTSEGKRRCGTGRARPSSPPSIKDDLLVRLFALDSVDIDPLRADLMARLEHHRDRYSRFERILHKRFPHGTASPADIGKLLGLRIGLRYERAVAEWCEEALDALSAIAHGAERHADRRQPARRQRLTDRVLSGSAAASRPPAIDHRPGFEAVNSRIWATFGAAGPIP